MATIGFVSLSEALFNQTVPEAQASQVATQSDTSTDIFSAAAIEDEFTPSAQSTEQGGAIESASAATTNPLAAPVATAANSEAQLQQLNTALGELGFDNANIDTIDNIALLINNFNPATFTFLANQLKAQQPLPPTATTTTASARTRMATA
jgi:hypothetical protein